MSEYSSAFLSLDQHLSRLSDLFPATLPDFASATASLQPVARAKLMTINAFALYTLLMGIMRLQGVATHVHKLANEQDRVKKYIGKVNAAENAYHQSIINADININGCEEKRTKKVDVEAAKRFVRAEIGSHLQESRSTAKTIKITNETHTHYIENKTEAEAQAKRSGKEKHASKRKHEDSDDHSKDIVDRSNSSRSEHQSVKNATRKIDTQEIKGRRKNKINRSNKHGRK